MAVTVLITGHAGLLGSRLADWFLQNKPEVRVVGCDDFSGGYRENVSDGVTSININVGSILMDDIFEEYQPDVVYHFAAYAAEGLSPFIRQFNYRNNLVATAGVVNNCIKHGVKRLVFTSSMAVYGSQKPPFAERMQPRPIDPYGVAKYACEQDIRIAGEQHGLDWCILRPHNQYGAKQNLWDTYRNVLGIWMYQLLHGQPLTIFGEGLQERAFSDIRDCLEPMWRAGFNAAASKQIINLGSPENFSIAYAAGVLQGVTGLGEVLHLEPRHEAKLAHCTTAKSERLLGFKHKTSLADGLKDMWAWALLQPDRPKVKREKYELDEGIYDYWK